MPEWEGSIAVNTAYAIIHEQELPFRSYTTVIINHYYALKGFRHKLHPLVFPQWAIISRAICYSQNPKKLHSHDDRLESQENFPQLITWKLFQLSPSHMWLLMLLSFPILLPEMLQLSLQNNIISCTWISQWYSFPKKLRIKIWSYSVCTKIWMIANYHQLTLLGEACGGN